MPTAYVMGADGSCTNYIADNHCGEYCDSCGDCLRCYGDDPCGMGEGEHAWVVYADQAAEFHADHPEAVRAQP